VLINITSYKGHKQPWTWDELFVGGLFHEAPRSSEYMHIVLNNKKILQDQVFPIQIMIDQK
jgi:hypothetical protein